MMRFLIDMNLSPDWVDFFQNENIEAVHWSQIGNIRASDADAPSVVQARTQDTTPEILGNRLLKVIHQFQLALEEGALLTFDEMNQRIRVLPLK